MNKINDLHLRCSDNDLLRLTLLCDYYHMSKSDLIRYLLTKEIDLNENLKKSFHNFLQYDRSFGKHSLDVN